MLHVRVRRIAVFIAVILVLVVILLALLHVGL